MEPVIQEPTSQFYSTLECYSSQLMNEFVPYKWGAEKMSSYEFEKITGLPRLLSRRLLKLSGMNLMTFFINLCSEPQKLCFTLFDFDGDDQISKNDCHLMLSSLPCIDHEHDEFIERKIEEVLAKVFTKKRTRLTYSSFLAINETQELVAPLVEFMHRSLQLEKILFFFSGKLLSIPKKLSPQGFSFLCKEEPGKCEDDGGQNLNFLDTNQREGERPWDMEGMLYVEKKPGIYSKYHYCLIDKHLFAFKSKEAKEPTFLVHLAGVYYQKIEDSESKMKGFDLVREKKTHRFYLSDEEEAERWERALCIATGQADDFFKDYKLIEKLGEGRSGSVWKAQCLETKKIYAVKCMERSKSKKAQFEMDMLKTLKHPGIVRLYRFYENAEHFRIVEEIGNKGTLREFILNLEYLDQEQSINIVKQLALALCYLKRKGVLHRDIKPENVVITDHYTGEVPRVKFVDFGLSTCLGVGETCTDQCGTLCFTAPEVLQGKEYNYEADVYSLGVLFYELLSRSVPYSGPDRKSILEAMKKSPRYDQEEGFECLSGDTESLLRKMLEKNPKKRIQIEQVYAKLSRRRKFSSL